MWWDGKIQRTFRCRLQQKPGALGRLLSAIGDQGGLIGGQRPAGRGGEPGADRVGRPVDSRGPTGHRRTAGRQHGHGQGGAVETQRFPDQVGDGGAGQHDSRGKGHHQEYLLER